MYKKLIKGIKTPKKALRYLLIMTMYTLRKKRGTLIFIGMDKDGTFGLIHRGYKNCYGFEPNPDRFDVLIRKYSKYDNIKLFNVAVTTYNGEIDFNISSNNDGASSSIGNFDPNWYKYKEESVRMEKSITVKCINLYDFCKKNNIDYIDDYISDIQGMDLTVLKTMKPMILSKNINTISCEVTKDDKRNIYIDLPDNTVNGFEELLKNNYRLISVGSGLLKDNKFESIPNSVWEMDYKWVVRN